MSTHIKTEQTPQINTVTPTSTSSVPADADLQALWDLGQLLFYANTYENLVANGSPQPQTNNALAAFQNLYGDYNFNGPLGTITFNYTASNGSQQIITITDPGIFEILQHLPTLPANPTATDWTNFISTYQTALNSTTNITWSDGQQETLMERMLMATYDAQYSMENNLQNTTTNTALLMFYLSFAGNPSKKVYGFLDQVLSEGYYDGAMFNFGNIRAIAQVLCDQLANNPSLKAVIIAGLQAYPNDTLYSLVGQLLATDTPGNATLDWEWESSFFPVFGLETKQSTPAVTPDEQNSYLENRIELAKKAMENKGAEQPHRIALKQPTDQ